MREDALCLYCCLSITQKKEKEKIIIKKENRKYIYIYVAHHVQYTYIHKASRRKETKKRIEKTSWLIEWNDEKYVLNTDIKESRG